MADYNAQTAVRDRVLEILTTHQSGADGCIAGDAPEVFWARELHAHIADVIVAELQPKREHGTFRVRWETDSDPGTYSSGVLSTREDAEGCARGMRAGGWPQVWIESAVWMPTGETNDG